MISLILIVVYLSIYVGLVATSFYVLSFLQSKEKNKKLVKDNELTFVSVIIPAYNEENSIAKTLRSILSSDYPENKFEVIVVDDGSKDKTYEIAKRFQGKQVRIFTKKNGGKGSALNFGIKQIKGDFVLSMDADTFVSPKSLKNMIRYFKDEKVMSVTAAMVTEKPKNIWQRVQNVEYLFGLFLRKAFATVNAVYITPGAFSAYRKSFFDKYGGYEEGNITEDLELSMRIQKEGFVIENCPDAPVYTIAPRSFKALTIQRIRWYFGLIKNTLKYKQLFGPKYGDLGLFVLPVAWISIFFSIFVILYLIFDTARKIRSEVLFLYEINFDILNLVNLNLYVFERYLFLLFTNAVFLFIIFFIAILGFYLYYASKKIGRLSGLAINLPLFFIFFAFLFGFWWVISIVYALSAKNVKWR